MPRPDRPRAGLGYRRDHLDSHMHAVEARADLFDVYLDLAVEYGLPLRMITPEQSERLGLAGFHSAQRAAARGIICNDHLVYPWPRPTRDVFFEECLICPPASPKYLRIPCWMAKSCAATDRTMRIYAFTTPPA